MTEWTLGRAVDVCLRAYAEHLLTLVGHCPSIGGMTGADGRVVNLESVQGILKQSFDQTIREAAPQVIRPLQVHKQVAVRLAGTRDTGFLGVLLAPFTFRPGLGTLIVYLGAELERRAKWFKQQADQIPLDLGAPLDTQARRVGQQAAYVVLQDVTRRYKKVAAAPVVS